MPHRSPSVPQDNVALENEVNTQVLGHDKYGKVLRYGRRMTKSRLSSYGSIIRGSQSTSTISTLIEEMNAKHVEQIQKVQAEQAKFMDMMDACEKKYKALLNKCMKKGISIEFHTRRPDDEVFSLDDNE
ncbi:hypothetical protein Gogos_015142 [Gossypium gossypioides]|uniref:Uncharacterized protein n=1 Tax=Gossypium gossypioides TaxID=34282 RepID=A0A7J9C0X3_GOSGO|nr:hypothetical protein [Gossypium gossypioides]